MTETYFLGANSKNGFYSMYDSFAPGAFLHILKGSPGCGKSGFMKRIGDEAEARGMDVHRVLCSGDPDSLDGVYIPELNEAFADGTSPHAMEPQVCGVDSDYLDLGRFLRQDFTPEEKSYVNSIAMGCRNCYRDAYSLISSACSLNDSVSGVDIPLACIHDKISEILSKHGGSYSDGTLIAEQRFLSCAGCYGDYRLNGEIEKLCKLIYSFDASPVLEEAALSLAAELAKNKGGRIICCPSPLCPEKLSAVLLCDRGLAFVDSGWNFKNARIISLPDSPQPGSGESDKISGLYNEIMALAYKKLGSAKDMHDRLEAAYRPHMDFDSLTKFENNYINTLF